METARLSNWRHVAIFVAACAALAILSWACGAGSDVSPDAGSTDPNGTSGGPSSSGGPGPSTPTEDAGNGDGGGVVVPGGIATEANFKVAFIGDTASGSGFKSVLQLIKRENAKAVMIQGDLTYDGENAADWFPAIDNEINQAWPGSTATVTIPYFVSRGNHDSDWGNLGAGLKDRMAKWNVTPEHNDPTKMNYSVVYKGLKMVMVADSETSNPTRAAYAEERIIGDQHIWKICSFHKNQRATNVGPKNDEMGWSIYENCRAEGAIVAQAHSHTYSRSKTIANDQGLAVDASCSDPFSICVGRGKHFFFDSSLGGHDTRSLDTGVAGQFYWGATYTGSFGALFIEFNVDGDPRKAKGYFKTTTDVIIDPPASSGKTSFDITRLP